MGWRATEMLKSAENVLRTVDMRTLALDDVDDVRGRQKVLLRKWQEYRDTSGESPERVQLELVNLFAEAIMNELILDLCTEKGTVG